MSAYISTSTVSLPLNKWTKVTLNLAGDNSPQAFGLAAVHAQIILVRADDANTKDVYFGPNSNADFEHIGPGGTYRIDAPHLQKISLGDWFARSNDLVAVNLTLTYV
jgi:hypothetical protein